ASLPAALEYVLDVDTERRRRGQAPRAAFPRRQPADPEHQLSGTVELPRPGARGCSQGTFQLQDGIRDKLRPIAVTLAYGIRHARAQRRAAANPLPPLPPVL
ncbi:ITA7 protein, partial [Crypturellus undulatus]|nr:ITA7 protein [Crypturellus undulatus]